MELTGINYALFMPPPRRRSRPLIAGIVGGFSLIALSALVVAGMLVSSYSRGNAGPPALGTELAPAVAALPPAAPAPAATEAAAPAAPAAVSTAAPAPPKAKPAPARKRFARHARVRPTKAAAAAAAAPAHRPESASDRELRRLLGI